MIIEKLFKLCGYLVFSALSLSIVHGAPSVERWTPSSKLSFVVGPVTFSPDRISFEDNQFMELQPAGQLNILDNVTNKHFEARIFQIKRPADPVEGGSPLCGAPITFLTLWMRSPRDRTIALYSSKVAPRNLDDGICASFSFDVARSK